MFTKKEGVEEMTEITKPVRTPSKGIVPSIISADLSILGNLISEGTVEIEGSIEGNVTCHGITVRKSGLVKGDIVADEVHIDGEVHGLVKAKHIKVAESGKIVGVIMYESLSIEDGAYLDGQCKSLDSAENEEESSEAFAENVGIVDEIDKEMRLITETQLSEVAN